MAARERFHIEAIEGVRVGRFNFGINTTFIVYRVGDTLIDSGPPNQWAAVSAFVEERPLRQVLLTHHHEDHSGNAGRIAAMHNLVPMAPEPGRAKLARGFATPPLQRLIWGAPSPLVTEPLADGLQLDDGSPIVPIPTPGHAKDLTCFHLPHQGWLFSGDLYLSRKLRYLRSDENLTELMASLRRVLTLEFDTVLCPHRGPVRGGHQALQDKLDYLEQLCDQAQSLARQGCSEKAVLKALLGPEDWLGHLSRYNISKTNLIRQALKVPR
ncbi:MBL fold metallo-hydrolase [Ferrimonas balearica]|uniref:MBL fold metallo-hydrolase n=1 Tax=Ferrimonas balearica TaxID=44012 RepID=UPI001C58543F|nr:MBL fold metallo-hydrolase [Ferrimonas balearica]MBW3139994.1 MBL fold metallo-hydrolase [Ferrimonas balearica]